LQKEECISGLQSSSIVWGRNRIKNKLLKEQIMIDLSKIDKIIEEKGTTKRSSIPILQAIQREYNYLPEEVLRRVSELTTIKPAEIIGVASFYSQFRLEPVGEHMVRVCIGT
jgi:NADH-quinone oxidoreductase subunit F